MGKAKMSFCSGVFLSDSQYLETGLALVQAQGLMLVSREGYQPSQTLSCSQRVLRILSELLGP